MSNIIGNINEGRLSKIRQPSSGRVIGKLTQSAKKVNGVPFANVTPTGTGLAGGVGSQVISCNLHESAAPEMSNFVYTKDYNCQPPWAPNGVTLVYTDIFGVVHNDIIYPQYYDPQPPYNFVARKVPMPIAIIEPGTEGDCPTTITDLGTTVSSYGENGATIELYYGLTVSDVNGYYNLPNLSTYAAIYSGNGGYGVQDLTAIRMSDGSYPPAGWYRDTLEVDDPNGYEICDECDEPDGSGTYECNCVWSNTVYVGGNRRYWNGYYFSNTLTGNTH